MRADDQMTVGIARSILARGPLVFGDSLQIRLLALDVAAEELVALEEPSDCTNCDGTGTVYCDSDNCDGHDCCMCDGDGEMDPPSREAIERYTEAHAYERLHQARHA